MIEQALTVLLTSLGVLVWFNTMSVSAAGTQVTRDSLRAQNLAMSKLDDFKTLAREESLAWNWPNVTRTAQAEEYTLPNVEEFEGKNYTWRLSMGFAEVTPLGLAPTCVTCTANMITITAEVSWEGIGGPKRITIGAAVSNIRG